MKQDAELLILGLKTEMNNINKQFTKLVNQDFDIISDDRVWSELKELKSLYDEYQYKLLQIEPIDNEIPF